MTEEKKELKQGDDPSGIAQPEDTAKKPETTPEGQPSKKDGEGEEDLAKQLEKEREARKKAEEERENYKQGMLSAKAKEISLTPEPQQPVMPPGSQQEIEDDELKKTSEIAKREAQQVYQRENYNQSKLNEQIALKNFMRSNPELASNDGLMRAVVDEYANKHGKSVEGVLLDLQRAYNLVKIDMGVPVGVRENPQANEAKRNLASIPSGAGESKIDATKPKKFDNEVKTIMEDLGVKGVSLEDLRKKVASGEMDLPDNVKEKLFS